MEPDPSFSLFELTIDEQMSAILRTASRWGKFLAVLGFILGSMILMLGFALYSKITGTYNGVSGVSYRLTLLKKVALRYLLICVLFAGVMFTGAVFTFNFSNWTSDCIKYQ